MMKKINVHIKGERVCQKVYFERSDKSWLKGEASKQGISVSKYLGDLVQREIEREIKLDLEFGDDE